MNFSKIEGYFNRFCGVFIFYVALILAVLTILPDSIVPIQLPDMFGGSRGLDFQTSLNYFYAIVLGAGVLITVAFVTLPSRIVSEMNFWLMISVFLMLPFLYSRDTKENFLLVKETALRIFLLSMFAIYLFRRLSFGKLMDDLARVPWHLYAFVGIGVVSILWTKTPFQTFHYSLILISYLIFYIVMSDTMRKSWQLYSLSDILITAASIASMYGILQYYRVAGTDHNYDPLFGVGEVIGNTDRKRVFSFFGNPVFLGVYLDAALPIAFSIFFSSFATGTKWAHRYEKFILRSQVLLSLFAVIYSFTFMALANGSVSALVASGKLTNALASEKIVAAGSMSFIVAPVLFGCALFGLVFLYYQLPYWQQHEKQIYRAANGLFCFLTIFTCLFITFTRTAWIATAASLFAFVVFVLIYTHDLVYSYRKWIIGFVTIFIFATVFLTAMYFKPGNLNRGTESIENRFKSAFTVVQRIMLYDITLNIIRLNPLFGHGLGSFGHMYPVHQAKFYAGEFRYFIDWTNSFGKMTAPNRLINFVVWSFEKVTSSRAYQAMMTVYFIVFLMGGILLVIYFKDMRGAPGLLNRSGNLLSESLAVYSAAICVPVILVFMKFLGTKVSFLGPNDNILSINPEDYHWLSAGFAHVHNEYLQVWADMGLFALLVYLFVFFDYFRTGTWLLTKLKNSPHRVLIIGYLCAIVAALVESLANFPFQRIMPILITCVGFSMIFNGRRIFAEELAAGETGAPEAAPEDGAAPALSARQMKEQLRNYRQADDADDTLFEERDAPMNADDRGRFAENLPFYAVVSLSVLLLNYFPVRYVLGNVDLKSGHTFISQAQMYRGEDGGRFQLIIKEGLKYLERSCQRVPYNSESWFWWGDTLKLIGDYDSALQKFGRALELTNTKHVFYSSGIAYFEKYKSSGNKDFMKLAIENWKNAVAVNPNFSQPLFHLGYYDFQAGNFEPALTYFKKAIKWDNDGSFADAYRFAGISAYYLKRTTEAIELLSKAKEKNAPGVSKYLGGILYQQSDFKSALPHLEEAFNESPGDTEVYSHLINAYRRLGMGDRALETFEAKNKDRKGTPEYQFDLGRLLAAAGNFDKALIELGKGLEKSPNDVRLIEEIGRIYFEEKKDYTTAITFWEKIIKLEPDNVRSLYNYGACLYRLGNYEKALELWKKVQAKDKNFPGLSEHMRIIEEKLGKKPATPQTPDKGPSPEKTTPQPNDGGQGAAGQTGAARVQPQSGAATGETAVTTPQPGAAQAQTPAAQQPQAAAATAENSASSTTPVQTAPR